MSSAPALVQIKGRFIGRWWVVAGARGGFCENEIKRESETGSSVTVGFVSPTLFHTLHQCPPPTPSTTPHPAFLQGGGSSQRPLLSPPSSLSDLLSSVHTLGSPQGKNTKQGEEKRKPGHRRRSLKKEQSSFSQIRVADRGPCDARSHRGLCENQHV